MSDRLKDLQRQRALAQEQLAWIDAEIAKEGGQPAPVPSQPAAPAVPTPARKPTAAEAARMADEILAQYKRPGSDSTETTQGDVKRGCYVYFVLAFVIVAVGVIALYFYSANKQH